MRAITVDMASGESKRLPKNLWIFGMELHFQGQLSVNGGNVLIELHDQLDEQDEISDFPILMSVWCYMIYDHTATQAHDSNMVKPVIMLPEPIFVKNPKIFKVLGSSNEGSVTVYTK